MGRPELADCLNSPTTQVPPPAEVIVVNNAPDQTTTRALVVYYGDCVRYVPEPRRGVAHARNRCMAEAHGEILAFLDDDCLAAPG